MNLCCSFANNEYFYNIEYRYKKFLGISYPNSIIKLVLSTCYQQREPVKLPDTLLYLFVVYHNGSLTLPSSLVLLHLGYTYNYPIVLPNSLIYFAMSSRFNQPIKLPDTLVYLKMGHNYSQPIELPDSLRCLELCNQNVVLPKNLFFLSFSTGPKHKMHLPQTLKTIAFNNVDEDIQWYLDNLPNSITHVVLEYNNENLSYSNLPNKFSNIATNYHDDYCRYYKKYLNEYIKLSDNDEDNMMILNHFPSSNIVVQTVDYSNK